MNFSRAIRISPLLFSLLLVLPTEAHAFGKKKPKPEENKPAQPVGVQAKPFRYVELRHVTTPAFYFPNGVRADFNADLATLVDTEINSSKYLRTQITTPEHRSRLVITGGVTTLELDVLQLNFKIGWNTSGPIPLPGVPNATGELDLKLSALSMDFKIYDRVTGQTYLAHYTNETLSNVKFQVKVNVDNITGSLDVLYKTKIAEALRTATRDIMQKMENNPSFDLLPWEAKVLGIDRERNRVIFGAGNLVGVKQNQVYSIYSGCTVEQENSPDGCFSRFLADIRVDNASNHSAEAVPFTDRDSIQQVYAQDRVYVKPLVSTGR